jgi:transposase
MDRVIIGVDPHKLSVTIEARDSQEILRATGQFATDGRSYRQLSRSRGSGPSGSGRWKEPMGSAARWCNGCWPAGNACWTCPPSSPPAPAFSIPARGARPMPLTRTPSSCGVALRDKGLREVSTAPELMVLRMWAAGLAAVRVKSMVRRLRSQARRASARERCHERD